LRGRCFGCADSRLARTHVGWRVQETTSEVIPVEVIPITVSGWLPKEWAIEMPNGQCYVYGEYAKDSDEVLRQWRDCYRLSKMSKEELDQEMKESDRRTQEILDSFR
jgi:hypothetical protein